MENKNDAVDDRKNEALESPPKSAYDLCFLTWRKVLNLHFGLEDRVGLGIFGCENEKGLFTQSPNVNGLVFLIPDW
ncbi:hypothetical protein SLA2020_166290 [Shorea laevis]